MRFKEALEWSLTADTVLHRLNPWSKLVGVMVTIVTSLLLHDPKAVALLASPYLVGCCLARIPGGILARLSLIPVVFLGVISVLMIPVGVPGQEVLLYAVRGVTGLLAVLVATLTTPFNKLWSALVAVLPTTLAEVGLIFHRSVYRAFEAMEGTLTAARVRGWKLGSIDTMGSIIATLLVRSYRDAELLWASVEVRGVEGEVRPIKEMEFSWLDLGWLGCVLSSVALSGVIG